MQLKVIQNNKNHTPRFIKHTLNLKNHTFHLANHTFFKHYIRNSRILTITGLTSTLLLSLLILTIYQPLYYYGKNEQKVIATTGSSIQATTSLSITTASNVAGVDLLVKDNNGSFASSDDNGNTLGFSVATDYHNGYTLSIASAGDSGSSDGSNGGSGSSDSGNTSNNNGKLIYEINNTCRAEDTCPVFNSISAASNTITNNGTWGYKPSKLNSIANNNYLPSPTTTPTILDKTTTANTTGTSNSYSIAIGAKADYTQIPGVYSNSYTLQAIVNIVEHAITFNKDDNITSIVIKDASSNNTTDNGTNNESNGDSDNSNSNSNSIIATTTNNTDTINLIYGDTYTIELNFADNYELDSLVKSSGVGELTIDTSGSSTNITKATFIVGNGIATIDAKSKPSKVYMQDLTLEQCKQNVGTNDNAANIGDNITVYDRRDGSDYTVRYINGACWMTQNLRITGTISAEYSNFADGTFDVVAADLRGSGYSYTQAQSHVADSIDVSFSTNSQYTVYQLGAWYNYCAASAGTVCTRPQTSDAAEDICPSSWHLPIHSTDGSVVPGNIYWLRTVYSASNASAFEPIYGGYYANGSIVNAGRAYWQASTAISSNQSDYLSYYRNSLYAGGGSLDREYGLYVRCVRTS